VIQRDAERWPNRAGGRRQRRAGGRYRRPHGRWALRRRSGAVKSGHLQREDTVLPRARLAPLCSIRRCPGATGFVPCATVTRATAASTSTFSKWT
jgi:hypothetical protein